nr:TrkA family potassium uptake protein [Actinomycetota bacterium]
DVIGRTTALAVRRANGDVVTNPAPDLRLAQGDLLVLLGEKDALRPVEEET